MTEFQADTSLDQTASGGPLVFCLSVEIGRMGTRKKIKSDSDAFETEMDREMLHLSKDVLQSKEYAAIKAIQGATRAHLRKKTAGNSHLRSGIYLTNAAMLDGLDSFLEEKNTELQAAVKAFVDPSADDDAYRRAQRDAIARLGSEYNPDDYPAPADVAKAFWLKWRVFSFPNVDALKELSPAVWRKEKEKTRALWSEAMEASRQLLRREVSGLVEKFAEALEPDEDGKLKKLNKKSTDRLLDFAATFSLREVSNDVELKALLKDLQDAATGLDPKAIKSDDALRVSVADRVAKIKDSIGALVVPVGRVYNLDDEDAEQPAPEGVPA